MCRFVLVVSCVLFFASCEKEKLIEVEREYNWQADENFVYDNQLQMNSGVSGDLMFFIGHTFFTCITGDDSPHPDFDRQSVVPFALRLVPPPNRKVPIGEDFFVSYTTDGLVTFVPNRSPISQSSQVALRLDDLDPSFRFIDGTFYSSGESMVINDQNKVLIPYQDGTLDVTMALVHINYDPDDVHVAHKLDTISTQIIRIDEPVENVVIHLESIGSNFFVTTDNKVFRIDGDTQMQEVLDQRLYRIFEMGSSLYGIGQNEIFISTDDGLTWTFDAQHSGQLDLISYTKVGDRMVAYRHAQIWEVSLSTGILTFTELDNDGLDGKSITSISLFEDKTYVTTLSGVFTKEFSEFFVAKETEE